MKKSKKLIMLVGMLFGSVALVSAGFAAWVIGGNEVSKEVDGNIKADTVTDSTIGIEAKMIDGNICFGWKKESTTYDWLSNSDEETGNYAEDLEAKFTIKVTNKDNLDKITLTFASETGNWTQAVSGGLVTEPTYTWAGGTGSEISKGAATELVEGDTITVTMTFGWGSLFDGKNPMKYFNDLEETSENIENAKTRLGNLQTYLGSATFKVTVKATAAA